MLFECSVCWTTVQNSQGVCTIKCGHVFHKNCLENWLDRSPSCPLCRGATLNADIKMLIFTVDKDDTSATYDNDIFMISEKDEIRMLKEDLDEQRKIIEAIQSLTDGLLAENTRMADSLKGKDEKIAVLGSKIDAMKKKIEELENCAQKPLPGKSMKEETTDMLSGASDNGNRTQEAIGPNANANDINHMTTNKTALIGAEIDTGLSEALAINLQSICLSVEKQRVKE